jgi:endonuclease YncB( thermonuclease family)
MLLQTNSVFAAELDGHVVGVTDGDTINLVLQNGQSVEIRLDNIDAPETSCHQWRPSYYETKCVEQKQSYGKVSKDYLIQRIFNRDVRILLPNDGSISYNRLIGTVYLGDQDINYELVSKGLAWHYRQYARKHQSLKEFLRYDDAQSAAQNDHVGLWADSNPPMPPWVYRHQIENNN